MDRLLFTSVTNVTVTNTPPSITVESSTVLTVPLTNVLL